MSQASILNRIPSENDNYPAAQRLLDEAVDAAVRPMPIWATLHSRPVMPRVEDELKLPSGERLQLRESYGTTWYAGLAVGSYIEAESLDAAKPLAVALVIDRLERALAELRFYNEHLPQARKPSNGQPSVTAATSAALVEDYAGKE